MDKASYNITTREGPVRGESLGAPDSRSIGPIVSGGANRRLMGVGKIGMREEDGNTQGGNAIEMRVDRCLPSGERETGNREGMSGAICHFDNNNMDLTCTSDSESSTRILRSSKARGRPRQLQSGKKRRIEANEAEQMTPSSEGSGQKSEFIKPRTIESGEDEIQDLARSASMARASLGICTNVDSAALTKQVADDVDVILRVASKSKNLKGTFTRALKDAGKSIKEAIEALSLKFSADEASKLQAENACLRREVCELRNEMAELRKEMRQKNRSPTFPPNGSSTSKVPSSCTDRQTITPEVPNSQMVDEIARSIMIQVGNMIDARMSSLEKRLPPEERLRPPLAADRRSWANVAKAQPKQVGVDLPKNKPRAKKSRNIQEGKPEGTGPIHKNPTGTSTQTSVSQENGWTKVGKGGRKEKSTEPKTKSGTSGSAAKSAKRKLRPPRSAAVLITLHSDAEKKGITYKQVLTEAKKRIGLSELGIPGVRFRQAASGARVLEIPGKSKGEMADSLAQKLRELIPEEVAKVSRPVRCADLRIYGLDDSVEQQEIAAAIALKGGCPVDKVKVGTIRYPTKGLGTVWVSCPVAAAGKVVDEGRLLVGWVSAQVRLLKQRPLRCFRCFQVGHVHSVCTAEIDRSAECYRCGQPGHKAATCLAEPNCSLCAAAGRPAKHRIGGDNCQPPPKKGGKKAGVGSRVPSQPDRSSTTSGETRDKEGSNMAVD